ncbi:hypothetical protein HNE72_001253 [Salmonella enterica]|uniref:Uncharacterized protein n=1 Tax=Salmonella enterica subsp. houtenae serovar 45:g,z51:- TaxID=1967611 RepID=A0A753B1Z2_SALHO|nr:hypothetical protein [Salmonella enterica]EBP3940482.1 hypothetical protein [Salmonella enterica subsp. enterica]HAF0293953.1 hypothetical protein [Salmonella enterica subsp. houtenae serovar 43:z4,z32:-]HCM1939461.1 hypothetical protein [Salmonella enterica subsp. houtenae serovar 57:z4,z23:-]HCM1966737.1 hypothetical protein [Salmonella enterica subsp. houtenae serovar 41:z29:-]AXE02893.1 hypothetical protein CHD23_06510 [Salmonella enterica]
MKFFIFIFLLCKVCSAFGEDVIYLTSREQSSLKIVSDCLPDNESFESYKASIEDKKDFIEIIFFESDEDMDSQGGGGKMYVYHVDLKNNTCILVSKTLMK